MKLYNKTDQIQAITVYDRRTKQPHEIYVCAKGTTEIFNDMVIKGGVNEEKFLLLDDNGVPVGETPKVFTELPKVPEEVIKTTVDAENDGLLEQSVETVFNGTVQVVTEDEPKVPESVTIAGESESSSFVCEICGAEFASARGLSTHMKKSHSN